MTFPRFSHTQFALDFYPEGIKFMPSFSFGTQAGSASYETVTVLGPGNAGTARPRPENVEQLPAQRSHCTEDMVGLTKGAISSSWGVGRWMVQQSLLVGVMLDLSVKIDQAHSQLLIHHHLQAWGVHLIPAERDHLHLLALGFVW